MHTDIEEAATGNTWFEGADFAVISRRGLIPAHQSTTFTRIIRQGNAVRNTGDHWILIVSDGHHKAVS